MLADPGAYIGRKLFLTGGAAVSFAELSAALSLELGTPVSYREISLEQAQSRWQARGLPADVVEGLLAFAAYQREGGASAATSDCVSAILGRSPRDIRDFVCDYRAHFVPR